MVLLKGQIFLEAFLQDNLQFVLFFQFQQRFNFVYMGILIGIIIFIFEQISP